MSSTILPMKPRWYSGTFTVVNTQTQEYRTFRIQKEQADDDKFLPGCRIVGLLTGPDNYYDFTSFGHLPLSGEDPIKVWKKYQDSAYACYANMLDELLGHFKTANEWLKRGYIVEESRECYCCGRKLTEPESIELGIGPTCLAKIMG